MKRQSLSTGSLRIIDTLHERYPDTKIFRKGFIEKLAVYEFALSSKDWSAICCDELRVSRGKYDLSSLFINAKGSEELSSVKPQPKVQVGMVASVSNNVVNLSNVDSTYVPFGSHNDVKSILKSNTFFPIFISGLSGNGKTYMVEQVCAQLRKECIRVQINPETCEDDLIGGFRLVNGETVFAKGPVIKAMESGSVLLLDEIDRATNKIMCLQGVLEGKPVLIKKTGEVINPADGFTIVSTANTKGKGSDDGRFSAASIIDEAFLERFVITIEQEYPTKSTEKKILNKHMELYSVSDTDFINKLVDWSEIIRKTYFDDGVDDLISTRRLCHIVKSYAVFNDKLKAIEYCIARFEEDTKEAFLDLYTKLDDKVIIEGEA